MIHSFQNHHPSVDETAWVAHDARVLGEVTINAKSSVWFHSVIRSENESIIIGELSNIQDNCVLHTDEHYHLVIGDRVTIGHQCIIHGCVIGDDSLIGMGAIVMNGAVIGDRCIVGAGALVTEHMQIPDDSIVVGSPAKVIKPISQEQLAATIHNANHYHELAMCYKQEEQSWTNMD